MSMDIYTRLDSVVVMAHPNNGYDSDIKKVHRLGLVKGAKYKLKFIDVRSSYTFVQLYEFPGEWFNSVHFENVPALPEQQAQEIAQRCAEKAVIKLCLEFATFRELWETLTHGYREAVLKDLRQIILQETGLVEKVKAQARHAELLCAAETILPDVKSELISSKAERDHLRAELDRMTLNLAATTRRDVPQSELALLMHTNDTLRAELAEARAEIEKVNGFRESLAAKHRQTKDELAECKDNLLTTKSALEECWNQMHRRNDPI